MLREPDRRPARVWTIVRVTLAGVFLAGIAWVLLEHREELGTLEGVVPSWLVALVVVSIVNQAVIGYAHRVFLLEAYDVDLRRASSPPTLRPSRAIPTPRERISLRVRSFLKAFR